MIESSLDNQRKQNNAIFNAYLNKSISLYSSKGVPWSRINNCNSLSNTNNLSTSLSYNQLLLRKKKNLLKNTVNANTTSSAVTLTKSQIYKNIINGVTKTGKKIAQIGSQNEINTHFVNNNNLIDCTTNNIIPCYSPLKQIIPSFYIKLNYNPFLENPSENPFKNYYWLINCFHTEILLTNTQKVTPFIEVTIKQSDYEKFKIESSDNQPTKRIYNVSNNITKISLNISNISLKNIIEPSNSAFTTDIFFSYINVPYDFKCFPNFYINNSLTAYYNIDLSLTLEPAKSMSGTNYLHIKSKFPNQVIVPPYIACALYKIPQNQNPSYEDLLPSNRVKLPCWLPKPDNLNDKYRIKYCSDNPLDDSYNLIDFIIINSGYLTNNESITLEIYTYTENDNEGLFFTMENNPDYDFYFLANSYNNNIKLDNLPESTDYDEDHCLPPMISEKICIEVIDFFSNFSNFKIKTISICLPNFFTNNINTKIQKQLQFFNEPIPTFSFISIKLTNILSVIDEFKSIKKTLSNIENFTPKKIIHKLNPLFQHFALEDSTSESNYTNSLNLSDNNNNQESIKDIINSFKVPDQIVKNKPIFI